MKLNESFLSHVGTTEKHLVHTQSHFRNRRKLGKIDSQNFHFVVFFLFPRFVSCCEATY